MGVANPAHSNPLAPPLRDPLYTPISPPGDPKTSSPPRIPLNPAPLSPALLSPAHSMCPHLPINPRTPIFPPPFTPQNNPPYN